MSSTRVEEPFLLFDGDCAFCSSSARWLAANGRVTVHPWQQFADLSVYGLPAGEAPTEVHWVVGGQRTCGGADAICAALIQRGGALSLVGRLGRSRPLAPIARLGYGWVARNRHRLPGGTPACATQRRPMPS